MRLTTVICISVCSTKPRKKKSFKPRFHYLRWVRWAALRSPFAHWNRWITNHETFRSIAFCKVQIHVVKVEVNSRSSASFFPFISQKREPAIFNRSNLLSKWLSRLHFKFKAAQLTSKVYSPCSEFTARLMNALIFAIHLCLTSFFLRIFANWFFILWYSWKSSEWESPKSFCYWPVQISWIKD